MSLPGCFRNLARSFLDLLGRLRNLAGRFLNIPRSFLDLQGSGCARARTHTHTHRHSKQGTANACIHLGHALEANDSLTQN